MFRHWVMLGHQNQMFWCYESLNNSHRLMWSLHSNQGRTFRFSHGWSLRAHHVWDDHDQDGFCSTDYLVKWIFLFWQTPFCVAHLTKLDKTVFQFVYRWRRIYERKRITVFIKKWQQQTDVMPMFASGEFRRTEMHQHFEQYYLRHRPETKAISIWITTPIVQNRAYQRRFWFHRLH